MSDRRTIIMWVAVLTLISPTLTICAGPVADQPYAPPASVDACRWTDTQLLAFIHRLTDYVYANHVVTDPHKPTYGMTYEFFAHNRKYQVFGLDTMHDGAWFMNCMAIAHRAFPRAGLLQLIQDWQVPFYVNMLKHSDQLFPDMKPTGADRNIPYEKPLKGWAPRGWEDGSGYNLSTNLPHQPGYHTSSNHLIQDLSDSLMNVWLTTRDPQLAQAAWLIHEYKAQYFPNIQPVEVAAAVTNDKPQLFDKHMPFPPFTPTMLETYYPGMYLQRESQLPTYNDVLAWDYRQAVAHAVKTGHMPENFILSALARTSAFMMSMELYFDQDPYQYGLYFFDLQVQPRFLPGAGKLDLYESQAQKYLGGRGIQISWVTAGILPYFARHPEIWEKYYHDHHAGEPLIRMVDNPPALDAVKDPVYDLSQTVTADDVQVSLISDPRNLNLYIRSRLPQLKFTIQHAADNVHGEKRTGIITVGHMGECRVIVQNDLGAELLWRSAYRRHPNDGWAAELRIPYTVVPHQSHWINGVDHGRYTVTINDDSPRTVYLLSRPQRILKRLEDAVVGTIDTWNEIHEQYGFIPSGFDNTDRRFLHFEISDVGNVGHLIAAIGLWDIYQKGQTEWDLIRQQSPAQPLPHTPLPDSVLRAQGISAP